MSGKGQMSKWSNFIVADRPEEIINIKEDRLQYISQYIGFTGITPANGTKKFFIVVDKIPYLSFYYDYYYAPNYIHILTPNVTDSFCIVKFPSGVYRKAPKIEVNKNLVLE